MKSWIVRYSTVTFAGLAPWPPPRWPIVDPLPVDHRPGCSHEGIARESPELGELVGADVMGPGANQ